MQVLQYLLDDVSEFISTQFTAPEGVGDVLVEDKGCVYALKAFIDYLSERERENFRSRRHENKDSVSLTTIHQVFLFLASLICFFFFLEFLISF